MDLSLVLPIIINFLLIALITLGIVLMVKLIITMNKINRVVDNIEDKVNSLNSVFNVIDAASNKVNAIYSRLLGFAESAVEKIFFKNKEERKENEDE